MDNVLLNGFYLNNQLVEPLSGEISGDGDLVHLPSKSMEVLLFLAKHPRHLVTGEDILTHVWGDGRGNAEALHHAISEIRHRARASLATPPHIHRAGQRGKAGDAGEHLGDSVLDHRPEAIGKR